MIKTQLSGTIAAMCICALGLQSQGAEFIPLGGFPSGTFGEYGSNGIAISNNGIAVTAIRTSPGPEAFPPYLWTKSDGRTFIGDPPGPFSFANAVTDDAQLVVGTHRIEQPDLFEQAFKWTPATGVVPLSGLPNGATHTEANDVTPDGAFIVGFTHVGAPGSFEFEAYRITENGELLLLGDLPGGQRFSVATSVSADGTTITGYSISAVDYEAFVWTEASGMVGLAGASELVTQSFGRKISADGNVIVGSAETALETNGQAFRWTQELGIQFLGVVPAYETASAAFGVSGDGSIIVGNAFSGTAQGYRDQHGTFVWDALHGIRDLQQTLEEEYALADTLSGWKLTDATDISADGLSIVGTGLNPDGVVEAWLVRLDHPLAAPEPNSLALLLLGGSILANKRRRTRQSYSAAETYERLVSKRVVISEDFSKGASQ